MISWENVTFYHEMTSQQYMFYVVVKRVDNQNVHGDNGILLSKPIVGKMYYP